MSRGIVHVVFKTYCFTFNLAHSWGSSYIQFHFVFSKDKFQPVTCCLTAPCAGMRAKWRAHRIAVHEPSAGVLNGAGWLRFKQQDVMKRSAGLNYQSCRIYILAGETHTPVGLVKIWAYYCQQWLNSKDQRIHGEKNSFITLEAADLQKCGIGGRNGIDPAFQSSTVIRIIMLFFFLFFFPNAHLFFSSSVVTGYTANVYIKHEENPAESLKCTNVLHLRTSAWQWPCWKEERS